MEPHGHTTVRRNVGSLVSGQPWLAAWCPPGLVKVQTTKNPEKARVDVGVTTSGVVSGCNLLRKIAGLDMYIYLRI